MKKILLPRNQLGKNVCRLREIAKLTQDKLAEKSAIDRRYVQRIEAGTANPGIDVLARLKVALDTTWEELLKDCK